LTPDQQSKVSGLRSGRDKRRGVQVVESRSVKQRSDDVSAITNSVASSDRSDPISSNSRAVATVTTHRNRSI
jgi:hypothetical protein